MIHGKLCSGLFTGLFYLLVAAQFPATADPQDDFNVSAGTTKVFTLEIKVPKQTAAGLPVMAELSLRNETVNAVAYRTTGSLEEWGLTCQDSTGAPVDLTRFGRLKLLRRPGEEVRFSGKLVTRMLKPGEAINATVNISRLFDLSCPGIYQIRSQYIGPFILGLPPLTQPKTEAVTVLVTERQ